MLHGVGEVSLRARCGSGNDSLRVVHSVRERGPFSRYRRLVPKLHAQPGGREMCEIRMHVNHARLVSLYRLSLVVDSQWVVDGSVDEAGVILHQVSAIRFDVTLVAAVPTFQARSGCW